MAEFEMPIEEQIRSLARQFGTFEKKMTSVEAKLGSMDSKLDSISIQLEDTNRIGKLGLEGLEALRETTERRFSEAQRDHVEQTDLLKSVLVHVRKRVERVEGIVAPKRRRRS